LEAKNSKRKKYVPEVTEAISYTNMDGGKMYPEFILL
jgi:hypothetical protein